MSRRKFCLYTRKNYARKKHVLSAPLEENVETPAVVLTADPAPETLPVAPETLHAVWTLPVAPETLPVAPETLPVAPETLPVAPETFPVAPETLPPVAPETLPVATETIPVAPETLPPVAPKTLPVAPDTLSVSPGIPVEKLLETSLLPAQWICSKLPDTSIAVYQFCSGQPPCTTYMLKIFPDHSWTLHMGQKQVAVHELVLFEGIPCQLHTIDDVLGCLTVLSGTKYCVGNPDEKFKDLVSYHKGKFLDHHGDKLIAYQDDASFLPPTIRHSQCDLLICSGRRERCLACEEYRNTLHALVSRHSSRSEPSSSSHTNFRYLTTPEKIGRLQEMSKQRKVDQLTIGRLREKLDSVIEKQGVILDEETTNDLHSIMDDAETVVKEKYPEGSFQQLFWTQQRQASSRPGKGRRWLPLMIKWCIYLRHQSSKAYDTLRESGCIQLPSQRTLRDYTNCVKARAGFSAEVDQQLTRAANLSSCPDWQKLVILLLDEMYIREDLVYNKHSGRMIGFVDLGNVNNHLLAFERSVKSNREGGDEEGVLAKTVMAMMVRGVFTTLRFPFAHFPCEKVTGELLFHPFWEAIYRLERMGLKVLGVTFDGAAVNRRLLKLHDTKNTLHKVNNIHASDKRDIFFFSDPPHLIKTTRNCMASKNRSLWNNGRDIAWRHIVSLYKQDTGKASGLAMVQKLKFEHIYLTSFSKMRVDLAAQVLSGTVGDALMHLKRDEVIETSKFVTLFDKFFDLLNVSNFTNGTRERKRFLHPYRREDDFRLDWLEEVFIPYLDKWEASVFARSGFTKGEQERMLLSAETRLGLRMTAKSFVGMVKMIFSLPEVKGEKLALLSNNICQDPLENFFGCQRQRGGTSDNPNLMEYYQNTQALRIVDSFCRAPVRGNCRGSTSAHSIDEHSNAPLPKRPRKGKSAVPI